MELSVESIEDLIGAARLGQDRVRAAVDNLSDDQLDEASLLPEWTRRKVVAHLVGNARGQWRMLIAARTGATTAQYPGGAQGRATEIEEMAALPAAELRAHFDEACRSLVEAWHMMPPQAWTRPTNALVRVRPAWASIWARWRETEVHHVDLDVGYATRDWPSDFVDLLIGQLFGTDGAAALALRLPDDAAVSIRLPGGRSIHLGNRTAIPTVLTGANHALAAWALGRPAGGLVATVDDRPTAPPPLAPFA